MKKEINKTDCSEKIVKISSSIGQCDGYPYQSYHKVKPDKNGILWLADRLDSIPKQYDVVFVDEIPADVKHCPECDNVFHRDHVFIDGMCIRSWEKVNIPRRDEYVSALTQQIMTELCMKQIEDLFTNKVPKYLDILMKPKTDENTDPNL